MSIMLLPVHIVAGGLAIILGGLALAASKGATLHRRSGLLFVCSMLTMGISGSILALRQSLTNANVLGGFMSVYFVITALSTVRPVTARTQRLNFGALVVAIALSLLEIVWASRRSPVLTGRSTASRFLCCSFLRRSQRWLLPVMFA